MNDAFDRLKKRARPVVPPRDTSLIPRKNDQMTEVSHSVISSKPPDEIGQSETSEKLPEVVRRTIRIEEELDYELDRLCRKEKITREVFLEAAYQVCENHPEILAEVIENARERYQRRKSVGELRKLKTLSQKHG